MSGVIHGGYVEYNGETYLVQSEDFTVTSGSPLTLNGGTAAVVVLGYVMSCSISCTVQWKAGAAAQSGVFTNTAVVPVPYVAPFCKHGWFGSAAGVDVTLEAGAGTATGHVLYITPTALAS